MCGPSWGIVLEDRVMGLCMDPALHLQQNPSISLYFHL